MKKTYILIFILIWTAAAIAQEGSAPASNPDQPEQEKTPAPATTDNLPAVQAPVVRPVKKKPVPLPPPPPAEPEQVTVPTGNNPFEIGSAARRQAPVSTTTQDTVAVVVRPDISGSTNPFEIKAPAKVQQPETKIAQQTPVVQRSTSGKPSNTTIFGIILGMLLLLSVAVSLNRFILKNVYQAFLNDGSFRQALKDRMTFGWTPFAMLYIFFLINAGVFVYLMLAHKGLLPSAIPALQSFVYCLLGVSAVFLFKHLIIAYIGFVFPVEKESSSYQFMMTIFGIILGLLLVPVNIFLAFAEPETGNWLIAVSLVLIAILYVFRAFRSLNIVTRFLTFHKLHFLLYLCAVEVTPLMILTKLIYQNI